MENSAVEWLYNKMYEHKGNITISEYEQAKQMFEQQIMNAWNDVGTDGVTTAEQYYKETFKSK